MKKQRGISLTGFLTLLAILGFVLFIGMKLFPMYQEYWAAKKALQSIAQDSSVTSDAGSISRALERRFDVGYVDNITPRQHLKVERVSNGVQMTLEYEVRKPLVYNLDIVGKFKASEFKASAR